MLLLPLVLRAEFNSTSGGGTNTETLQEVIDALAAKHGSLYMQVHYTDDTAQVAVSYEHSPNAQIWTDGQDLRANATASEGMHSETAVDLTEVAKMRVQVKVTDSGSSPARVVLSLWLVLKPF